MNTKTTGELVTFAMEFMVPKPTPSGMSQLIAAHDFGCKILGAYEDWCHGNAKDYFLFMLFENPLFNALAEARMRQRGFRLKTRDDIENEQGEKIMFHFYFSKELPNGIAEAGPWALGIVNHPDQTMARWGAIQQALEAEQNELKLGAK